VRLGPGVGRVAADRLLAPAAWASLPTLVVGWAVFAQVVSFRGLVTWVVLGSLGVWLLVGALLSAGRVWRAMAIGMPATVLLALAADRLGGATSGPLARSTLLVVGLVVAAQLLAFSRVPALSLLPMLAMLACGLALGAAGSAFAWIGAWVVAAACSLLILGPYGSNMLAARERLRSLATLIALVGVAAVLVASIASALLGRPWMVAGVEANWQGPPAVVATADNPPVVEAAPAMADAPPLADLAAEASPVIAPSAATAAIVPAATRTVAPPPPALPSWVLWFALAVAVLGLWLVLMAGLLLAWFVGRRLVAWGRWRLLRLRLSSGTPEARVIGAWTWMRLRMAWLGTPLPAWVSPDTAAEWSGSWGNPDLVALADLTAALAFNPAGRSSTSQGAQAWRLARLALRAAQSGTLRDRIARAGVGPPVNPLTSLASGLDERSTVVQSLRPVAPAVAGI